MLEIGNENMKEIATGVVVAGEMCYLSFLVTPHPVIKHF